MLAGLLEKLIGPIFSVIDQTVEDKDERARLKQQVQLQMMTRMADLEKYARDVIVAEAQGESYLQRNWRPILMLVFTAIVANNYILAPYLDAMFGWAVVLEPPEDLWELLKIGVGGYIVGRSAEKGVQAYTQGRVQEAEVKARSE